MSVQPPRLRLVHLGNAGLRVEWPDGALLFDPPEPPGELPALLCWNEPERVQGVLAAVRGGQRPRVVASDRLLAWLAERGPLRGESPPVELQGVRVEALAHRPVPYVDWHEGFLKARSALLDPLRAARRLRRRLGLPSSWPLAYQLSFPDGRRLLHLNCALHRWTELPWVEQAAQRFGEADWVVAGVDYGQQEAFASLIAHFNPQVLVLADLVNQVRRRIGMPTEPLSPLADRLRERGLQVQVLAPSASLRFER